MIPKKEYDIVPPYEYSDPISLPHTDYDEDTGNAYIDEMENLMYKQKHKFNNPSTPYTRMSILQYLSQYSSMRRQQVEEPYKYIFNSQRFETKLKEEIIKINILTEENNKRYIQKHSMKKIEEKFG